MNVIGIKHLVKVEKSIKDKLRRQAKPYKKPIWAKCYTLTSNVYHYLKIKRNKRHENIYLFGIDNFPREFYAAIYSDNVNEYQGIGKHLFVKRCNNHLIDPKFTKPVIPQTNGKVERVIRALMVI
ncbi:hypothetical protein A9G24_10345 [Gilliamella sp. App6-5]|uniref:DDE-type integrase/transposase/recombinase n=1 Tax=Gilliamella sp. App6-5 TaxID=3120232 RepID=UPI00080E3E57|nr:DDE-type integrase/transposase/recombinase [Gilliamella apicola]OCG10407.1 hypothetical protein A9G24_10345 [Gilliamella apicola]